MTGEPDNPVSGTDNAVPISETDNLAEFDYFDPEEDNVEVATEVRTDDETQEAQPEAEVSTEEVAAEVVEEAEPQAETEDQTTAPISHDSVVELADGNKSSVADLIAGNMKQADYTRKSQENSNIRKRLEADAAQIQSISNAFVDYLTSMVPPEPSPALASTDYQSFLAQKAQHDAAMTQVQKLVELGGQPQEIVDGLSEEQHKALQDEEQRKLAMVVPEVATKEGKLKFFNDTLMPVADEVGFSKQDVQQILDHRVHILAKLAKEGLDARKAKTAVREKVQQAVPATPRKPGQAAKQANTNAQAMRKLSQSGSIHDAMNIDFE